jgi:hypothetical protein
VDCDPRVSAISDHLVIKEFAMQSDMRKQQESLCARYGAALVDCPKGLKVGISQTVRDGEWPINGVRHPPVGDTSGWFIWAGELSQDPDFFVPLHVDHLNEWCPMAIPYLLLSPGWRFQVAPCHEDVWFDPTVK